MISLVLGLGNIGERYKSNRHNLGFCVVERLIETRHLKLESRTREYDWVSADIDSVSVVLAKPRTYMNLSGVAARALLQRYELEPTRMLVVVDDFALPLGRLRIRASGSDGGHNGLASIIAELGTEEFPRLRLGIGPLSDQTDPSDFVLGDFEQNEIESVEKMIATACEAVVFYVKHGLDEAMSKYNQNPA